MGNHLWHVPQRHLSTWRCTSPAGARPGEQPRAVLSHRRGHRPLAIVRYLVRPGPQAPGAEAAAPLSSSLSS